MQLNCINSSETAFYKTSDKWEELLSDGCVEKAIAYGISSGRGHGYQMTDGQNQVQSLYRQIDILTEVEQNVDQI